MVVNYLLVVSTKFKSYTKNISHPKHHRHQLKKTEILAATLKMYLFQFFVR